MAAVALLGLAGAVTLYMAWFHTTNIAHREFDMCAMLLSAIVCIWLLLRSKPVEKPE